jgi:hypothetical protein
LREDHSTMVITSSNSTGTLLSLNKTSHGLKRVSSLELLRASPVTQSYEFCSTDLLLPEDDTFCDYDDSNDDESFYSCSTGTNDSLLPKPSASTRDRLYLPSSTQDGSISVDDCLRCLPSIMETCDALLARKPVHYTDKSRTRILNVGQQEAAHAVPLQCDVLMSDRATTCHVLALRSVSGRNLPLASLAHLDGTRYEACIRAMVQKHICHHYGKDDSLLVHTSTEGDNTDEGEERMELELHIVGGFSDYDGTSKKLSNWLFRLLADIASEEKHRMDTTLRTCAISSMNDDGRGAPIGRGLGLCLRTGEAFLASCDASVAGPDAILRSLRLWNGSREQQPKLEIIQEEKLNMIKVTPFPFSPFSELEDLLALSDERLLLYTSTSPDCEEDDFCPRLRQALVYLRDTKCAAIFGPALDRTHYFKRMGFSNQWKPLHSIP